VTGTTLAAIAIFLLTYLRLAGFFGRTVARAGQ
jgi:hypothetical protein